jgi:hypothetical protein
MVSQGQTVILSWIENEQTVSSSQIAQRPGMPGIGGDVSGDVGVFH